MKKPLKHLIAGVPRSVAKVELTIGIDLGTSGVITARSTKMEKWLTGGGFERHPRESRSGLPIYPERESRWRRECIRSGLANSFESWVTRL